MTLIYIYKSTYTTWLPFVFFFRTFYVWFVTSHVASFYNEVMAFIPVSHGFVPSHRFVLGFAEECN